RTGENFLRKAPGIARHVVKALFHVHAVKFLVALVVTHGGLPAATDALPPLYQRDLETANRSGRGRDPLTLGQIAGALAVPALLAPAWPWRPGTPAPPRSLRL